MIASAETRNIADFHFAFWRAGEAAFEVRAQLARAVQVATHVRADTNFRAGRRREMKMRIKTGDAVNLIKRSLRARGQRLKLRLGQEAVALLNGPQIVKNHGARLVQKRPAARVKNAGRKVE